VGALTGAGHGDVFVSSDGTHPTEAGVQHLGARIAEGVRAALAALYLPYRQGLTLQAVRRSAP